MREQVRRSLVTLGLPLGSHASDADVRARWVETDARYNAIFEAGVAAHEARRVAGKQAGEWAQFERRHGTAHPDRVRARIGRGLQARAEDWQQGTERFTRPTATIGEAGRRARAQQVRATHAGDDNPWNDPELREAPAMIDGPRRSRR